MKTQAPVEEAANEMDALYGEYKKASAFKRPFIAGSLQKKMNLVLQKRGTTKEMLLRFLYATGKLENGKSDSMKEYVSFLKTIFEPERARCVNMFLFLSYIFDNHALIDDKRVYFSLVCDVFEEFNERSPKFHLKRNWDESIWRKLAGWERPEIPFLLESLIQLISAEKTKIYIKNNYYSYAGYNSACWIESSNASEKLAEVAISILQTNPQYSDLPLKSISEKIRIRAETVRNISIEDAKSYENYYQVDGNPPGSYKPRPGYFQVHASAAGRVNYVREFRVTMEQTQAILVLRKYLAQDSD